MLFGVVFIWKDEFGLLFHFFQHTQRNSSALVVCKAGQAKQAPPTYSTVAEEV